MTFWSSPFEDPLFWGLRNLQNLHNAVSRKSKIGLPCSSTLLPFLRGGGEGPFSVFWCKESEWLTPMKSVFGNRNFSPLAKTTISNRKKNIVSLHILSGRLSSNSCSAAISRVLCYAKNSLFCFRPFPEVTLLARRRWRGAVMSLKKRKKKGIMDDYG